MSEFDLVVIGAGSGGIRCARMAASAGMSVAVVEESDLGGTCVNLGCVPKKLFVYGAELGQAIEDARGFGFETQNKVFDWNTLRDAKNTEITRLNGIYKTLLDKPGATLFRGHGTLVDKNTVAVGDEKVVGKHILIATGGRPYVPEVLKGALVSDQMFHLSNLPQRLIVVGSGYIGLEFATMMVGLGVEVDLVFRRDLVLSPVFDLEVRRFLQDEMIKKGVRLHPSSKIESFKKHDDGCTLTLANGELHADELLAATGRSPNTHNLGLSIGVETTASGHIQVDSHFRTSIPNVFALGDVIGRFELTPVALAEGMALFRFLSAGTPIAMDYQNIPTAVFTRPSVATVGLTEAQASNLGPIDVYTSSFRPMKNILAQNPGRSFMKVIVDQASDRVLGFHMVGVDAAEIIQGMAVAIKAGVTKALLDSTIGIHPSAAEEFVTMRSKRS